MTAAAPLAGDALLAGRYRLLRRLGTGARKEVHLAHDVLLQRDVAVNTLRNPSPDEQTRLRREAALLARLGDSPAVVGVHDLLELDGCPVLVCPYLAGGSVRDRLLDGPLDVAAAVRIASDVATALERAHALGVVHRDVQPANVWLHEDGSAVLGDFGLALEPGVQDQAGTLLVGTVGYAAPEQLAGSGADARSDLYGLGALLYALLMGRPPGDGLRAAQPVALSSVRPDVPAPLADLVLALLAPDPEARPPSAAAVREELARRSLPAQVSPASLRSGFVGRGVELAELATVLDAAQAGLGGLTLVLGEPGVGKTRTSLELAHRARGDGWTVLTGRCHEDDTAPAFWPWTQVLRAALHGLPGDVAARLPDATLLAPLLPELVEQPGPVPAARFRVVEAAASVLTARAELAPVLVLLDDVHWMDRASVALTGGLTQHLSAHRVAIVVSARDGVDEQGQVLAAVEDLRRQAGRIVRLGGLSLQETGRYVEAALGVAPDPWLLRDLHDRTEGNPFHLGELVRLLQAEHRISEDGSLRPGGELVPVSVREVLHRRLGHVSDGCMALLSAMSVLGREVRVPVLCRVHGSTPAETLELLAEATRARLVVQVDGGARFRFVHALIREALYDEVPPPARAAAHRRVVEALECAHAVDTTGHAGEVAHHAVRAAADGDAAAAVLWCARAGTAASRTGAHEAAVLQHGRAVELAETVDLPAAGLPSLGHLLLDLGEAQRRLGQSGQAQLTFARVAEEAVANDDAELLARAALGYGLGLGGFGVVERADGMLLGLLEEAAALLEQGDSALRVRLLARLATELYFTPFRSRRLRLGQEALAMAERLGDPGVELVALYSRTLAQLGPDRFEERRRTAARVVWMANTLREPEIAFRGRHLSLMVSLEGGTLEQARMQVEGCRRIADVHRQPVHAWHTQVFEAMLVLAAGRHEEGLQLADTAAATGRGVAADMAAVLHGAQLVCAYWAQGRLAEVVDAARLMADGYPHAPAWRAALAFCLTEVDRYAEAQQELDLLAVRDFVDIPEDGNYLTTVALLAHTAARLGDTRRAAQLESKLRGYADRYVVIAAGAVAFTSVRLALGVVRATCGDLDAAVHDVATAHRLHQQRPLPACAVWSGEELARLLLARGTAEDIAQAWGVLQEALAGAQALGMPRHAERLAALMARASAASPGGTGPGSVTVLLSDMAGSTAMTERLGEYAAHALLHEHRRAVETIAADEGGGVLKVLGDGVLAALPSADAALRCAARLQQRYESEPGPVRLRIGVHSGEVLREGESLYGRTMILVFRVADAARAGEVLVSADARAAVRTVLAFDPPELLSLKGFRDPQPVSRLRWGDVTSPRS